MSNDHIWHAGGVKAVLLKQWAAKTISNPLTYHTDELYQLKTHCDDNSITEVVNRTNHLIVSGKYCFNQFSFVFGADSWTYGQKNIYNYVLFFTLMSIVAVFSPAVSVLLQPWSVTHRTFSINRGLYVGSNKTNRKMDILIMR